MAVQSYALIARLAHLYPLSDAEHKVLQNAFSGTVSMARDADIVRDGERPDQCSLLVEGYVYRYKILPEGQRQILAFHFPGEIFDTQSYLLDTMDHSVAALTPSVIGKITHSAMREITEDFPRITRALWKETLSEAAIFRQWLASVGRRSARERLAHLICEIYVRQRSVNMGSRLSVPWPFTQLEIADALGLTPIHVNRTLRGIRTDGIIHLHNGTLTVLNWDALVAEAEFDPCYLQLRDLQVP
jgi:CRP-like cAMP-binding protein